MAALPHPDQIPPSWYVEFGKRLDEAMRIRRKREQEVFDEHQRQLIEDRARKLREADARDGKQR